MSTHEPTIAMRNYAQRSKRPAEFRCECSCGYVSGWQRYRHLAELRMRDHVTIAARVLD